MDVRNVDTQNPVTVNRNYKSSVYIISVGWKSGGLFALYKTVMSYLIFAYNKGYIPVIDMKHFENQYFKDGRKFQDNVWEYFFEQPCNISLDNIPSDVNVVMSNDEDIEDNQINEYSCLTDVDNSRKLYDKYFNLTKFNQETQKFLDENYKRFTNSETEILGVLCRGTDYVNCRPAGHAIQPEINLVIEKAKELLKKYNYKKIWLATEDLRIYSIFKNEFGSMLIDNPQYKFSDTSAKRIYQINVERENHAYNLAKEYLLSIYILSKCKYFIGGITAGTLGAWFLSEGFKNQTYTYLWDLGVYKNTISYFKFLKKIFSVNDRIFNGNKYKILTILGIKFKIKKM